MSQPTIPGDLAGLHLIRLAKLTGVDMTATSVSNVYANGPKSVLIVAAVLHNFSAFTDAALLPASWAFSYGSAPNSAAAPTTPNNLRTAVTISGIAPPYVIGQSFTSVAPYLPAFYTLYFAITTATNGVGTFDVTFYGGILSK